MGNSPSSVAAVAACMLTPVDGASGYFTSTPGTLTLTLKQIAETVQFVDALCFVWDITNYPTRTPVDIKVTLTDVSFEIETGKHYHLQTLCSLLPSQYAAKAELREKGCGQFIYTVNLLNTAPGMVVTA